MSDLAPGLDLPFLMTHAVWARWFVLLGSGGLVIGVVALVRRLLSRRDARTTATSLTPLDGETLVRGVLRGAGVAPVLATLDVTRGGPSLRISWGAPAWIETPDGRVDLVGDVRVLAGNRAYAARRGIPRQTPEAVEAHAREEHLAASAPAPRAGRLDLAPRDARAGNERGRKWRAHHAYAR